MHQILRTCLILLLIIANVGCDQLSKSIVRKNVDFRERIPLIDTNLVMTNVENTGAFLSAGGDLPRPMRQVLFSLLPALVLVGALGLVLFKQNLSTPVMIGLCFVIGGGIGNVFDRIIHGSVTDFLHIDLGWVQTGIFNMADVSIMIGFGSILISRIRWK